MKKINDIGKRCLKTFLQGFLASLSVSLVSWTSFDVSLVRSALIGALAGGISALMNYINNFLCEEE